jgi:mutator protein MutT
MAGPADDETPATFLPLLLSPRHRLGCGAAIVAGGELLLVQRRKNPEAGHWGFPGGKVDAGERVVDAAIREIAEELDIAIRAQRLLKVIGFEAADGDHWMAAVYLATIEAGVPRLREPEALEAVEWFDLDRLPMPLTQATHQALPELRRARGR